MEPVHEQRPKSTVIRVVKKDKKITVFGVAWRGRSPIEKLYVSFDNWKTWHPAKLLCKEVDSSWLFWSYVLPDDLKGSITIYPRVYCKNGDFQPLEPGKYSSAYGNNSVVRATVKL